VPPLADPLTGVGVLRAIPTAVIRLME
jgi:hypothetical protein